MEQTVCDLLVLVADALTITMQSSFFRQDRNAGEFISGWLLPDADGAEVTAIVFSQPAVQESA